MRSLLRTYILCAALAGLSLLASQLIIEYVPHSSSATSQAGAQLVPYSPHEGTGPSRALVLVVAGLVVVAGIQLWRGEPEHYPPCV